MRIGLLGGSFDPAHEGHLYVSEIARKLLKLDYVWWLVSPGNPLKPEPGALATRLARARIAAAHHPFIRVSDIEQRLGTRYTIDTVTALKRRFPRVRFVWLMGSDNLEQFARWRRWQRDRAYHSHRGGAPAGFGAGAAPCAAGPAAWRGAASGSGAVAGDAGRRRNWESSTALRQQALGAAAEAMINLTP